MKINKYSILNVVKFHSTQYKVKNESQICLCCSERLPGRHTEVHEDVVHLLDPQSVEVGQETAAGDPAHHVGVVYQRVEHLRAGYAGQATSSDGSDVAVSTQTHLVLLHCAQTSLQPLEDPAGYPTASALEVGVLTQLEAWL